jgi:hypothetical protein
LKDVDGCRDTGAALLIRLATDHSIGGRHRVDAARALGRMDGYRGEAVRLLSALGNVVDSEYEPWVRSYTREVREALAEEQNRDGGSP